MARLTTILGFVCAFAAVQVRAATFTVTTAADTGPGSLRQAILDANANGTAVTDAIQFNIPGAGVQTIALDSQLPTITTPVIINGYTQPGASVNTLTFDNGNNAVILISVDGVVTAVPGLALDAGASGSTIRGLALQRFTAAIALNGTTDVNVSGNFIGTDATGTIARPNAFGVLLSGATSGTTIGDVLPAERNLISGNDVGVYHQFETDGNTTEGNYIGTDVTGMSALGNNVGVWVEGNSNIVRSNLISGHTAHANAAGILLTNNAYDTDVTFNRVGTQRTGTGSIPNMYGVLVIADTVAPLANAIGYANSGTANIFANSLADGVAIRSGVTPSIRNYILYNTYRNNAGLGIDLNDDGVTPNDPLDADTGANNLHNYPVITSAVRSTSGAVVVSGTIHTLPNALQTIQLYFNVACNPSGFGEGGFVEEQDLTTDAAGNASFTFALPSLPPNGNVSAIAHNPNNGDTSEFSACVAIVQEDPQLTIQDMSVTEGDAGTSLMTFTVSLSPASQFPVTVNAQTANDTALAPGDYASASQVLTFSPGQTTALFSVTVNGDTTPESNETFSVVLSAPTNASIADALATGTILDDDGVVASVDLSIAKTGPATVAPGGTVSYTIAVANNGSAAATNVVVTDTLPSSLTFVSATPSQGSCSGTTTITCALGTLAASATATIALTTTASTTPQSVSNTASVTADQSDPNGTNNASTAATTISAPAVAVPIPSLDVYGLIAITALLALLAIKRI